MKLNNYYILFVLLFSGQIINAQDRPNILLVMAEDISTDLACYGMEAVKTPTFDRLAEEGIKYTNCIGTNSICSPSRSALMVGAHQNITNAQNHRSNRNTPLDNKFVPITKLLQDVGYKTIIGNENVFSKGEKIDCNFKFKPVGTYNGIDNFGLFNVKSAKTDDKQKPFFAQVQLKVTHRGNWWNDIRAKSAHPVDPKDVVLPPFMADTPEIRLDWATYLDQIEYADNEMQLLLDELKENGTYNNTIIIFIGDNGRCNIRGKGYVFDSGLRIPLIVWYPKEFKGGKVDDKLVTFSDLSATILSLAGAEIPTYATGTSIFDKEERTYVYSARDIWDEIKDRSRAITTKRYKYIKNYFADVPYDAHQAYLEYNRPAVHVMRKLNKEDKLNEYQSLFFASSKEEEALYDLKKDPHELHNLINDEKYKKISDQLKGYMAEWQTEHIDRGFEDTKPEAPKSVAFVAFLKAELPTVWTALEEGKVVDLSEAQAVFKARNKKVN
ncbi:sulfatase-like hydrolase/transferase [Flammeovirga kamogawensis]|uniref:Sulfatase-like hydrolase/transferase n=1 Tax=Flammeovirga kamogawensis TaxID=373891 RepID=A0ABX8H3Z0_9BACT|nr:sulfatase-like hydrolase/transferase [Flammeovirga kamogawensis]MBB6461701.1 arylsulfatase A-like enzyme [Flammeovirga kamogawensis]QWG10621.1 sulfatase-like hydrolase/transferase [Flammeovirga kamogawensis]TRX63726.1 sulfatase-like hydrolase/transferase [Flammeovirga kamogawensis]